MAKNAKENEIELGNLKAHIATIKTNIAAENATLEALYATRTRVSQENESLVSQLANLKEERAKIATEVEEKLRQVELATLALAKKEEEFQKDKENFQTDIENITDSLVSKDAELCLSIFNKEKRQKELQESILSLTETEKQYSNIVNELASTKVLIETEHRAVLDSLLLEIEGKKTELETLNRNFNREKEEKTQILTSLTMKVEEEKEKIVRPSQLIAAEWERINAYEANLMTIYNRTKKAWEKLYPGTSLDNVLK